MKSIIMVFFFFYFCLNCFPQKNIFDEISFCFDYSIAKRTVDSLRNQGVKNIFVYQRDFDTTRFKNNLLHNTPTKTVTYIGWIENKKISIFLITDNNISKIQFISDALFQYRDMDKLWITKAEKRTELLAPNIGYKKGLFILFANNNSYFFEFGLYNLYYDLDKNKNIYRKRFFELLDSELSKVDAKWMFDRIYDREIDLVKKD